MTVQLSYRALWVYASFIAYDFNEEMNSFKGMGVLNVLTDKKSSRVSSSEVRDSPGSSTHPWSQHGMAELPRRSRAPLLPCLAPGPASTPAFCQRKPVCGLRLNQTSEVTLVRTKPAK